MLSSSEKSLPQSQTVAWSSLSPPGRCSIVMHMSPRGHSFVLHRYLGPRLVKQQQQWHPMNEAVCERERCATEDDESCHTPQVVPIGKRSEHNTM